ncbi:MAG: benzodiazapine receptor [Verrucomicrobiales bacterium]|jgi:benzodiazapine receptor
MATLVRPLAVKILLCIFIAELLGGLGAATTVGSISDWYREIQPPPGTPPNSVFGPVWSILYAMIGSSFAIVWHRGGFARSDPKGRKRLAIFTCQAILNFAWTPLFFGWHLMGVALLNIILMIIAIAYCIRWFGSSSRVSAWLLVPYLAWVCYATYLNAGFWFLNRS